QLEVEELRPKLKEVLYDCAVEIRANKAALYLFDGTNRFELVTEYGFRSGIRQFADFNDVLVDRCGRGRTPFYINGVASEPRFSELLYETSTDRLLAAPLYSRGKLVGFIDARNAASRIDAGATQETLSEAEVTAAREVLRSVLLIPGAVAAMFSAFGHLGGVQELAARTAIADDARNFLQSKLNVWLTKRGE